jgi:hypothetical protein
MNGKTGNHLPAAMRASDADRDAVLSDLSDHFQAGRLTSAELDERAGRALTARTLGELGDIVADLPAPEHAPQPQARTSPGIAVPPLFPSLVGIAITVAVVVAVTNAGWGLIWPLLAVLLIARPVLRLRATS